MRHIALTFGLTALLVLGFGAVYATNLISIETVSAQDYIDASDESDDSSSIDTDAGYDGTGGGGGGGTPGKLINPLQAETIPQFLIAVIEIILIFAVPIIVLFIMYAGFLYVTARGDTSQISKAHAALTWSVVGGVIVLGALLIVNVIQGTISSI